MKINPTKYFLSRYYSPDLSNNELKWMLNFWLPFILNRIKVISISNDFYKMNIMLKYSFWNRNPNKSVWGGAIASTIDPFFPIMMKQILLIKGIKTDFYSKSVNIKFIKMIKSNINFYFSINKKDVIKAENDLNKYNKYEGWHDINGIDINGNICVVGNVQVYLKIRKQENVFIV